MSERHTWIPVAFVRQTGGRLHVLFSLEHDGAPQHEGEPLLLVDHRPGSGAADVEFEAADALAPRFTDVLDLHRTAFADCLAAAFGSDGAFDADRLIAQRVELQVDRRSGA